MPPIILIAALGTIVITAGLTLLLYRINAPQGVRRQDGGDGGVALADTGNSPSKHHDGADSGGGSDGGGGD